MIVCVKEKELILYPSQGPPILIHREEEKSVAHKDGMRMSCILGQGPQDVITGVSIVSTATQQTEDKKKYTAYILEVEAVGCDSWRVSRRYNEFYDLDRVLRKRYVLPKRLPPKTLVANKFDANVVRQRTSALQEYLESLVASHLTAADKHVLSFLRYAKRNDKASVFSGGAAVATDEPKVASASVMRGGSSSFSSFSFSSERQSKLSPLDALERVGVKGEKKMDDKWKSECNLAGMKLKAKGERDTAKDEKQSLERQGSEGVSAIKPTVHAWRNIRGGSVLRERERAKGEESEKVGFEEVSVDLTKAVDACVDGERGKEGEGEEIEKKEGEEDSKKEEKKERKKHKREGGGEGEKREASYKRTLSKEGGEKRRKKKRAKSSITETNVRNGEGRGEREGEKERLNESCVVAGAEKKKREKDRDREKRKENRERAMRSGDRTSDEPLPPSPLRSSSPPTSSLPPSHHPEPFTHHSLSFRASVRIPHQQNLFSLLADAGEAKEKEGVQKEKDGEREKVEEEGLDREKVEDVGGEEFSEDRYAQTLNAVGMMGLYTYMNEFGNAPTSSTLWLKGNDSYKGNHTKAPQMGSHSSVFAINPSSSPPHSSLSSSSTSYTPTSSSISPKVSIESSQHMRSVSPSISSLPPLPHSHSPRWVSPLVRPAARALNSPTHTPPPSPTLSSARRHGHGLGHVYMGRERERAHTEWEDE